MKNMLEKLSHNSRKAIDSGIYEIDYKNAKSNNNIIDEIKNNRHAALITEVKFSSPSLGSIRKISNPVLIAKEMVNGGATGLSVLTQPYLFNGSPELFAQIRKQIRIPILMKDVVVDKVQIDAAQKLGADIILLIQAIFDRKFATDLDEFISYAHRKNLQVLLETHTENEFIESSKSQADIIGINNRDLDTLEIDLNITKSILKDRREKRVVVSESGIESQDDIRFLHQCGANAFLVGSSIMKSKDIKGLVSRLVTSI